MAAAPPATRPPASQDEQLDLRIFLDSLHAELVVPASSASASSTSAQGSKEASSPKASLPASALVKLIDARVDSVNGQIRQILSERGAELAQLGRQTVTVHRDVRALQAKVDQLEREWHVQVHDQIAESSPLPATLDLYARAHEQALYQAYSLATLRSLHRAVSAIEQLEGATSSHATDAELERLVEAAQAACKDIGIDLAREGNTAPNADVTDLTWLGQAPSTASSSTLAKLKWWERADEGSVDLPAVRLLGPRLHEAVRQVSQVRARRKLAAQGRIHDHGGEGEGEEAEVGGGRLSPADEVRRKARALILDHDGWASVTTVDLAASSGGDEDEDEAAASPIGTLPVGGRGMQLASSRKQPPAPLRTQHLRPSDSGGQPTCTISQRTLDLVRLAEETLVQIRRRAKRLSRDMYGGEAAGGAGAGAGAAVASSGRDEETKQALEVRLRAIGALLRALPDIFALHVALMPTVHPHALWSDARLALQFANDCTHVAAQCVRLANVLLIASNVREELGRLVHSRPGDLGQGVLRRAMEEGAAALETVSEASKGLAVRVINRQMIKSSR